MFTGKSTIQAGSPGFMLRTKKSEAYCAGYAITIRAVHPNISPSIVDRENWSHNWKLFMEGWNAGKRATEDQMDAYWRARGELR